MPSFDPYRTLMVHPEADAEIIQAAYRKLAMRYHPDVTASPEAAARMAELNAARDMLIDPLRRAKYDRVSAAASPSGSTPSPITPARSRQADPAPHRSEREGATAGPPPGNPSGATVTFGRYAGWSLGEIARADLEFLEWLDRMTIGRPYRAEIDAILRRAGRRGSPAASDGRRGRFRGR